MCHVIYTNPTLTAVLDAKSAKSNIAARSSDPRQRFQASKTFLQRQSTRTLVALLDQR